MSASSGSPAPAQEAAQELVAALVAGGVRHVVLAPGSRSAPIAYALSTAEEAGWLTLHVRADERVAAFLALGLSAGSPAGECAAVVTTSGTAVANLHPAVLEASHSRVPLVVVSADRPHEMRGTGANQTTDQVGIFGTAVRRAWDLPAGMPRLRGQVRRALAAAHGAPIGTPGPVHVNLALREPLGPPAPWRPGPVPARDPVSRPVGAATCPGTMALPAGERTVVVAGDRAGARAAELARAGAWPLLAEPSSGVRDENVAVPAYRALLARDELGGAIRRVVVLGHPTLTRPVSALLGRGDVEVVVLDATGPWYDVAGTAHDVVPDVTVAGHPGDDDLSWAAAWGEAGRAVAARVVAEGGDVPRVAETVWRADAVPLVLGSSSTVRDLDLVAVPTHPGRLVLANRGLAGIDGTLATAAGVALARGERVRVVVGDLTFLHDLGALVQGDLEREPDLEVVVLDDHGGGIFHTLEYGAALEEGNAAAARFERLFGTPQSADLVALAAATGARARRVAPGGLGDALGVAGGRSVLVVGLERTGRRALDAHAREFAAAHDLAL